MLLLKRNKAEKKKLALTESGYCVRVYLFENVKHCTTKQSIHSHLAVIELASVNNFQSFGNRTL